MSDNWFIKLHRKITEWEWYDDINTKCLFLHLLLTCNFEDKKWRGIDIKRWQIVTGRNKLAEETWLSAQETRTSLNKLKSTNEITIISTKSYSLIQVNNYESYQTNQPRKQPTSNHQSTTTKEVVSKDTTKKERIGREFFSYQEWNEFQEPFWFIYSNFIIEKREVLDECFKMAQWIWDHDDKPRYNWKSFISNWLLKSYKRRPKPLEREPTTESSLPPPTPESEKSESFHITDLLRDEEEQVEA